MELSSVSTVSLANALLEPIQQIQTQLSQDQVEASTGQYADLGLQLGQQSGYELSLRNQSDMLQTFTNANSILSTNLTTTQDALTSLSKTVQGSLETLTGYISPQDSSIDLKSLGASGLQQLISSVNATSNGQYVFGGQNSGVAPMSAYSTSSAGMQAIDATFQASFGVSPTSSAASSISSTAIQSFLDNQFASLFQGASWSSNWSSASSTNSTAQIAPGQTVEVTTSANQPAIQQATQAYAMLAAFGGSSLSQAAMNAVVSTASTLLSQGSSGLTSTQASIGAVQANITEANSVMSSQQTLLQTQIGNLDNVDAAQVATNLNTLSTQLETAYQLTDQLQKMSLAQYLPA